MDDNSYNTSTLKLCMDAFSTPPDSRKTYDMYGPAVSVANIIISVSSLIPLAMPSSASFNLAVNSALLHFYTNTFSIFLSFDRSQLYLFDGAYAATMVTSPFMTYLMAVSLMELFGRKTKLYVWAQSRRSRLLIKTLAVLSLVPWLSLNFTLAFSDHAFIDSKLCRDVPASKRVYHIPILWIYFNKTFITALPILFSGATVVFLIIGLGSIRRDFKARESMKTKPWGVGYRAWVFGSCGRWAWFKWTIICAATFQWLLTVISNTWPAGSQYAVSYGQLLSLLSVVPLLASALKILYTDGMDVLGGIRNEIRFIRMDMRYTFLGRVENLPSYNPSPQQQVTPMRLEGYEPVPTTRQWLLESFDLKL